VTGKLVKHRMVTEMKDNDSMTASHVRARCGRQGSGDDEDRVQASEVVRGAVQEIRFVRRSLLRRNRYLASCGQPLTHGPPPCPRKSNAPATKQTRSTRKTLSRDRGLTSGVLLVAAALLRAW